MPIMDTKETNCMARMAVKVCPRAPRRGAEPMFLLCFRAAKSRARETGVTRVSFGRGAWKWSAVRTGNFRGGKGMLAVGDGREVEEGILDRMS